MNAKDNKNDKSWDKVRNTFLIVSFLTSLLAITLNLLGFPDAINKFGETLNRAVTAERVQFWINVGNITVSTYFSIIFLRAKKRSVNYHIKPGKEYEFCELAELPRNKTIKVPDEQSEKELESFQIRVKNLVNQYLVLISLFAGSLALLYLIIIISSFKGSPSVGNQRFITDFARLTNVLNFLGGVIVFLAFWVLYWKSLNKEDKSNDFWLIPAILSLVYIFAFVGLSWLYEPGEPAYYFLNIFDLIAGSVNGLAMFLLFGRYVSLEQSLNETKLFEHAFKDLFKPLSSLFESKRSYTKLVSFAIIFLLPIYALAQPLFGSLEIELYGKNPKVFQTTVYGICLVGKLCFFHLTFLLLRENLLQLYLYGLVSKVGNFHKLETCLTTTR